MDDLELLRAAAEVCEGQHATLYPGIVRFQLETQDKQTSESLRTQITALLGTDNFSLAPLHQQLPQFLVLQFPGVERAIAPDRMFSIADRLVEALDLVSATPDIGSTLYAEPDARLIRPTATESVVLDITCWSQAQVPVDPHWSVKAVNATEAWAISPDKGRGVLIAQPDTGVASHPDLDPSALRLDLATDILKGGGAPTDPLDRKFANPGHGTATGSVVISRAAGKMVGTAPAASLIPIRCTTDVKLLDGTPVAAAIMHAVDSKADVITMSLGGIFSRSISAAVGEAVKAGMIVMAAAGNCVGFVVYPASDSRVIGVGGVDVHDRPWKGTSFGPSVTISAPAENVYVARRTPFDGGVGEVSGGQGTSFAVATTAGVAALWIAHFGRDAIRAEAKKRGITVQALFSAALTDTARRPPRWNSWLNGAGIVNAEKLLKRALADIPTPGFAPLSAAEVPNAPDSSPVAGVFESAAEGTAPWSGRYGAEATFLAADAWRRGAAGRRPLLESPARPRPSPGLAAAAPEVVREVDAMAGGSPALLPPQPPTPRRATGLASPAGSGTESSLSGSVLEGAGLRDLQDRVEQALKKLDADPDMPQEGRDLRRAVMNRTESVVRQAVTEGEHTLDIEGRFVMEALVRLTGRPAFKVRDGAIADADVAASDWKGVLFAASADLKPLAQSVGRIDLDGNHIGTGFVVGPGLIMTNRHVAQAIADVVAGRAGDPRWFLRENASINFDDRARGNRLRFKLREIVAAGPEAIGQSLDFSRLDMAIIDVETDNGTSALPQAVGIEGDGAEAETKQDIAVIGYPARPDLNALTDRSGEVSEADIEKRLAALFGLDYGRKYFSPGRLEDVAGTLAGDGRSWVVGHDATTLAGCSGSAVVRLADGLPIVALHFAGVPMSANYAHALAAVGASGVPAGGLPDQIRWLRA